MLPFACNSDPIVGGAEGVDAGPYLPSSTRYEGHPALVLDELREHLGLLHRRHMWALPARHESRPRAQFYPSLTYFPAGTQTLSAAAISAFDTSVETLTRWSPSFFFGTA
jgi:hypothetical protein